ncbi:DUF1360 domain-containing protein [Oceanobacillus salinisoli]|uniref:DUF1360 domain-containing protein n=1 Tax=Oceanobacillus salinisoli TaxID=2678611 RepID=UPI0012E205C3|nr:DUF1360 domain-containing protein [Oceanobacillus salinisoli]
MIYTWFEFILFTLAVYRLTRLIVYDKITHFIRRPFHEEITEIESDGSEVTYIEIKGSGLRYWIGDLLNCHWCTGMWISALLFGLYVLWPAGTEVLIIVLAIAGAAGILETLVTSISNEN